MTEVTQHTSSEMEMCAVYEEAAFCSPFPAPPRPHPLLFPCSYTLLHDPSKQDANSRIFLYRTGQTINVDNHVLVSMLLQNFQIF